MSFSDTFNRGDGALGADWNVVFGSLEVITNQAGVPSPETQGGALVAQDFTDDQTVSVVFSEINDLLGTGGVSLYARVANASFDDAYEVNVSRSGAAEGSGHFQLFNYAGSLSENVVATIPTVGQTLTLSAIGSTISVLVDDVEVISVTNTETPTGPLVGFACYFTYPDVAFDSFSVTDVPALGTMFMPPSFGRIPTTWPRGHEMNALMRNFRPRQEGTNVYFLSDGTVTETDPDSTTVFWDKSWGSPYVAMAWWGSTADPYELTEAQAQALTDAGYSLT